MKREYWIIIGIVTVVLAACGCAAVGAIVLWPNPEPQIVTQQWTPGSNGSKTPLTDPQGPAYSPNMPETPSEDVTVQELLVGVWQCVQGSEHMNAGSVIDFKYSVTQKGYAYLTESPNGGTPLQLSWDRGVGVAGLITIWQTEVPEGRQADRHLLHLKFPDTNTMLIYSTEDGHNANPPAVLNRMQ
jgi:hypothetical protein